MYVVTTHERFPLTTVGRIALAAAIAAVVMVAAKTWGAAGFSMALVVSVGGLAAITDARSGRIPDRLLALAALPLIGFIVHEAGTGRGGEALLAAVLGVVTCAAPMFLVHLASPSALGFGDVKLGAVLGAALGLIDPRLGLVALCVAAAVTSVVGLAQHRESLPLGPGLVLGATIAPVTFGLLDSGVVPWR
jgi:leader peptidase (prepilin peptidase)/N-methyltransferase